MGVFLFYSGLNPDLQPNIAGFTSSNSSIMNLQLGKKLENFPNVSSPLVVDSRDPQNKFSSLCISSLMYFQSIPSNVDVSSVK